MGASLLALPPELLDQIGPHLDHQGILRIRSTCTYLCSLFTPLSVYRLGLYLSTELEGLSYDYTPIPFVPTPDSLLCHIKRLRIRLDPQELDSELGKRDFQSQVDALMAETARLKSLKDLRIMWQTGFSEWVVPEHVHLLAALERDIIATVARATNGEVKELRIQHSCMSFQVPSSAPPFESLNLKELEIEYEESNPSIPHLIQSYLIQNPSLEVLRIYFNSSLTALSLPDLLPPHTSIPSLPLHTLDLNGAVAPLPLSSLQKLPSLSNLRHLKIRYIQTQNDVSELWNLLRIQEIRLQSLSTDYTPTPALLDYLTFFRGLHHLQLSTSHRRRFSEPIAHSFISHVLPLHAHTLRFLDVQLACIYEEHIGSGDPTLKTRTHWPPPADFLRLETLHVFSPPGWGFSLESCQNLLSWLEQIPVLSTCAVHWAKDAVPTAMAMTATRRQGVGDIRRGLVGRTGRPLLWIVQGLPSLSRIRWVVRRHSQDEWYFDDK
ncbi:hypothetical protein AX16_009002 [Volvariella volvacea WC 439]|nr:hypothetical protein AX16_009002 [Volvariella volvacea WC 439]